MGSEREAARKTKYICSPVFVLKWLMRSACRTAVRSNLFSVGSVNKPSSSCSSVEGLWPCSGPRSCSWKFTALPVTGPGLYLQKIKRHIAKHGQMLLRVLDCSSLFYFFLSLSLPIPPSPLTQALSVTLPSQKLPRSCPSS